MISGLLLPGAGQAYNGHPFRAFFVLLFSPLVLPWLLGSLLAWGGACKMVKEGGRYGKGGVFWVAIQAWIILAIILAALVALTLEGILI